MDFSNNCKCSHLEISQFRIVKNETTQPWKCRLISNTRYTNREKATHRELGFREGTVEDLDMEFMCGDEFHENQLCYHASWSSHPLKPHRTME